MRLISWDIGMENMAYCILEVSDKDQYIEIVKWNKFDILEKVRTKKHKCQGFKKDKKSCQNNSSMYSITSNNDRLYYCKTHSKQSLYPLYDLSNGEGCQHLIQKSKKTFKKCKNKAAYYCIIDNKRKFFCKRHSCLSSPEYKRYITEETVEFPDVMKFLKEQLVKLSDEIFDVNECIIELQPVHTNPIMKSIQMVVYSFYLFNKPDVKLNVIKADNKLKIYKEQGPEIKCTINNTHDKNKFLGKQHCKFFLNYLDKPNIINDNNKKWYDLFATTNKADDLADCLLQAMYYIKRETGNLYNLYTYKNINQEKKLYKNNTQNNNINQNVTEYKYPPTAPEIES